jgi:hypothetical protein
VQRFGRQDRVLLTRDRLKHERAPLG